MTKIKAYKWLVTEKGIPLIGHDKIKSHSGDETWKIGEWKEYDYRLELCNSGFHACRTPLESLEYIYGDRWFIVEADGEIIDDNDKFVCNKMRLVKELPVKKILPRFEIECAKRVFDIYEKQYPGDDRPRKVIEAAELFLDGKITKEELYAAAWAAAWTAEWVTEWVADEARVADAAVCAAECAAMAAGSARAAERKWQKELLEKLIIEE